MAQSGCCLPRRAFGAASARKGGGTPRSEEGSGSSLTSFSDRRVVPVCFDSETFSEDSSPRKGRGPLGKLLMRMRGEQGTTRDEALPSFGQSESSGASPSAGDNSPRTKQNLLCRNLTQQAAGHGGNALLKHFATQDDLDSEVPSYIIKVFDEAEAKAYMDLEMGRDELLRFTARYCGDFEQQRVTGEEPAQARYMKLENLLAKFKRGPHVMDVKIGCRSFTEEEVRKKSMRKDLYRKLIEIDPSAPTEEERQVEACTKYRYMEFNDSHSTLRSLCFRIDGIANSAGRVPKKALRGVRSARDAAECIVAHFLPSKCSALEEDPTGALWTLRRQVAETTLRELRELRRAMAASSFVSRHVLIGSSLLFVADAAGPRSGLFLIDFAKSTAVPDGVRVDHQSPWVLGNSEDGLFTGVESMIRCWEEVLAILGDTAPQPELC